MPVMIGHLPSELPKACIFSGHIEPSLYVRLSWAQAVLLKSSMVVCVLYNKDQGGPRRMAKRWYQYFVLRSEVLNDVGATKSMKLKALGAIADKLLR